MTLSQMTDLPFATSRVQFLNYIDVMVCAIDEDVHERKHVNFMIQVDEVGKGHWLVPRRYTQFRLLWRSICKIYRSSKVKETRHNTTHINQFKSLANFSFPRKTLKVLFIGSDSSSQSVVRDRILRFHAYLQDTIQFIRDFQWGEEQRHRNAITTKDATKLCWLLHAFLSIPKTFRSTENDSSDYLHFHPECKNAVHCQELHILYSHGRRNSVPKKSKAHSSSSDVTTACVDDLSIDPHLPIRPTSTSSVVAPSPMRFQKRISDPARPSVTMESMRPSRCTLGGTPCSYDYRTMPMLGESPRDTIILGE